MKGGVDSLKFRRVFLLGLVGLMFPAFSAVPRAERWRWSNPAPHGNNILDMTAEVQVGDGGAIHVLQPDGRWAPVNTGRDEYLRSTAVLDGRILVTGESGLILWSDDGSDFQTSELSPDDSADWFEGVCASGTRAVAVGDYGAVYTSLDGMQWTASDSGTDEWLRGVAFGGNAFVAVGENGTVLKSNTAAGTWNSQTGGTAEHLNRVRYLEDSSGGTFYAVGNSGVLLQSPDGAVWTALDSGTTNDLYDIALNNSGLLVVGDQEVLLSSNGGSSWVDQTALSTNGAPDWTYLSAYGKGNAWRAGGRTGLLVEGGVSQGETSTAWTLSPSSSSHAWIWDMTVCRGLRVAVGDLANIQTSLDGILWTSEAVPLPATNTVLLGVGGTSNLLVAVGNEGNLLVSEAGPIEVAVTNDAGTVTNMAVEGFGVVWSNLPAFTAESLQGVDAAEGLFLVCGGSGELYSSADGTNWTLRATPVSSFLSGIAIGPASCVAVGAGGTLLKGSADGTVWTAVSSGTSDWIYRVRWLEDRFVALGENGLIMTSPDGQDWTSRSSGTSKWLTDVTYLNGRWYVSGYQGTLLTSTDPAAWSPVYVPTGKSLFAAQAYGGQLILAGVEGVILRNQVEAETTPVEILDYSYSATADTNGVQSVYEVVLFGGQPDQLFTFNSCTNLADAGWTNLNGTLELYDASGTLYAIRSRDASNAPPVEFYTTELIP
ncbi:hypothetical protein [Pontiella agarivorans]|uniref:Photosynthesis system II assembly factor Ycf48/Hcf136-like domain-containing protein n=1 Tax=Pontiella agarivorans TaxID=3038953 RepID=A0ABU5MVA4_9BACT|nr:hypothetical protein [Pontiella agarivorans]MDZ8118139.1 hypothetical protein [Pontiella agarivorans]